MAVLTTLRVTPVMVSRLVSRFTYRFFDSSRNQPRASPPFSWMRLSIVEALYEFDLHHAAVGEGQVGGDLLLLVVGLALGGVADLLDQFGVRLLAALRGAALGDAHLDVPVAPVAYATSTRSRPPWRPST
ncbi:hypothetical protein AB1285_23180 [Microbacterium sp. NRRL B-14842]|uniref:hypothetical protein n=1 Tax=Microbacterium sp. NRRL B-14842 TaxID=3162881 RepID=UPI003D2BCBDC